MLQSATYKPGSTITGGARRAHRDRGRQPTIPTATRSSYTWRVDGRRAGGNEPRLVIDATADAKVTLAMSDGMVSVSSSWNVVVIGAKR